MKFSSTNSSAFFATHLSFAFFAVTALFFASCNKSNADTAAAKLAGTYKGTFLPGLNVRDPKENYIIKVKSLSEGRVRISAESVPTFAEFELGVMMANGVINDANGYSLSYEIGSSQLHIEISAGSFFGRRQ